MSKAKKQSLVELREARAAIEISEEDRVWITYVITNIDSREVFIGNSSRYSLKQLIDELTGGTDKRIDHNLIHLYDMYDSNPHGVYVVEILSDDISETVFENKLFDYAQYLMQVIEDKDKLMNTRLELRYKTNLHRWNKITQDYALYLSKLINEWVDNINSDLLDNHIHYSIYDI